MAILVTVERNVALTLKQMISFHLFDQFEVGYCRKAAVDNGSRVSMRNVGLVPLRNVLEHDLIVTCRVLSLQRI